MHCIDQLLKAGYRVRTTVRSVKRAPDVRAMLKVAGCEMGEAVTFVEADLMSDTGWAEAVTGCRFVLHVASPLPASKPKHEDDVILPAREGTLRVLRAARDAGVERVVVTSSFVAVGYGNPAKEATYDETSWTNLDDPGLSAYAKSKTLAERAAWELMAREGGTLEMATVNPVAVFGPVLGADSSASILLVQRLLEGMVPACPKLFFGVVDVRDVADLHVRAMTRPEAKGQRFLAVAEDAIAMVEMAKILKRRMGAVAKRVPTREMPDWAVRLMGRFNQEVGMIVPELGKVKHVTNAKARTLLGWKPRGNEEAIVATAESLVTLGLLKT